MIIEIIYQGRDNVNELEFREDGVLVDFSTATRMLMQLDGTDVDVDSNVSAEYITWTPQGRVKLKIGDLPVPASKYAATLIVFDPAHPEGQVLFHARESKVVLWFVPPDV